MNIGTEIVLNMIPGRVMPIVYVNQYDTGYQRRFRLYNGAYPFNIASNQSVTIRGTKGDGHGIVSSAESTVDSNVVSVTITEQMTAVKGTKNIYELRVVDTNGLVIGTANFILAVEKAALDDNTIISDSDLSYVNDVLNELQGVEAYYNKFENEKITRFTTCTDMKASTSLKSGMVCQTAGYYAVNDGGAALYYIMGSAPVSDYYETLQNGLIGILIPKESVCPEQFGAYGDGTHDDTSAIQRAINSGKTVCLGEKSYATALSIALKDNEVINYGVVLYSGSDYAFVFTPTSNADGRYYNLGTVIASNGGCLKLDSSNAWMQYLTFDFIRMSAESTKSCVYAKVDGNRWINEVRFLNGRFTNGENAVYIDHSTKTSSSYTSHWTFDRVGFESVTNGFNIPDGVTRTSFTNCRAEESLSNVVLSRASDFAIAQNINWYGAVANGAYWQNCNNYFVMFESGYITPAGTLATFDTVGFANGMLYGIDYNHGVRNSDTAFGAYTYDADTGIQEVDFATVYDYATPSSALSERPQTRDFSISNTPTATITNIYFDDRMFAPRGVNAPTNSFLLEIALSPNTTLNFYTKKNGVLIRSFTAGSTTTYPRYKITKTTKLFYIEPIELYFKGI